MSVPTVASEEVASHHSSIKALHKELLGAILSSGVDAIDLIEYIKDNIDINSSKRKNQINAINLSRDSDSDARKNGEKDESNHIHSSTSVQLKHTDHNQGDDNDDGHEER